MGENREIKKEKNIFKRMLEDKRAISECIRNGGNLDKLAEERGIRFAMPLQLEGRG